MTDCVWCSRPIHDHSEGATHNCLTKVSETFDNMLQEDREAIQVWITRLGTLKKGGMTQS